MDETRAGENRRVMQLLAAGIPLSLLIDLVTPPNSAEILASEGLPPAVSA